MIEGYTNERCPVLTLKHYADGRASIHRGLKHFATFMSTLTSDFAVDENAVDKITERLFQRINYYLFFHGAHLTQSRQNALKAYWILKYHPLRPKLPDSWKSEYNVNAHFAFYVLFAQALSDKIGDCANNRRTDVINNILREYQKDYIRALSEYDISKEAMIVVSDGLKSILKGEIADSGRS